MSKDTINVPHVRSECTTSNPAFYVIFFECCICIEFSDQRFTNSGEFTKEFIPTLSFKTTRNEGILKINKIHISLLNDWSCFELMGISLKVLRGAKQVVVMALSLVTTLSNRFSRSHLQNIVANTTKIEHKEW